MMDNIYLYPQRHEGFKSIDLKSGDVKGNQKLCEYLNWLKQNYFVFKNTVYHQEFGMAMGTPMAVNIANAFLTAMGVR